MFQASVSVYFYRCLFLLRSDLVDTVR